jgi:FtsP/CotA-like multicopper oxidase with cupredoxin domain
MKNPWWWMAHCHIAEHMHAGMMMHFEVRDKKTEENTLHNH